jgi:hypothetical protein
MAFTHINSRDGTVNLPPRTDKLKSYTGGKQKREEDTLACEGKREEATLASEGKRE